MTSLTTAHQDQVRKFGSATESPGSRRTMNLKAKEDFAMASKLNKMAELRYSQRYAAMILDIKESKVRSICLRFGIKFNASTSNGKGE